MNIELNTPRNLSHRQKYVTEITARPDWTRVGPYQEVSGWTPGITLKKNLVYDEIVQLTKDIVENKRRIEQWRVNLKTATGENAEKYTRMIRRWQSYTESLMGLRATCQRQSPTL